MQLISGTISTASTIAAVINFPLWRASAIAQSGFKLEGSNAFVRYYKAVIHPPFRGIGATIFGMSWARASIFFGADIGKAFLQKEGYNPVVCQTVPALVLGTVVQIVNQPLVRATITVQDPKSELTNVRRALVHIYKTHGVHGLWHGTSVAVFKTVPKYITAVAVKDYMEDVLPLVDPSNHTQYLVRSAIKSVTAGIAGAVLTNPLDVLRNEYVYQFFFPLTLLTCFDAFRMFKTDLSMVPTLQKLLKEEGWAFGARCV